MQIRTTLMLAGAALLALVGSASAGIVGNPITVTATNGSGTGSFTILLSDGNYDAGSGTFTYSQAAGVHRPIVDTSNGNTIAFVDGLTLFMQSDPVVSLGFAVQAGSTPTSFTIASALGTFAAINNPSAHSSAGMTITDTNADTVTMHGNHAGPNAYRADYNGLVPSGTNYSLHCANFFSATSNSESDTNTNPIAGAVSSISAGWAFTLTPFDSASGTSNFTVVPAPGALMLLGMGGLAVSRRRR